MTVNIESLACGARGPSWSPKPGTAFLYGAPLTHWYALQLVRRRMQAQQKSARQWVQRIWLHPPVFMMGTLQLGHFLLWASIHLDVSSSCKWEDSAGNINASLQHGHSTVIGRKKCCLATCASQC
mmetsp:Transcript_731/g.1336  ORF Transcript_731/g.1336 Transcript_731/m.1336 type:complete len:125 (+) Transcript_731:2244-2618(+)